MNIILITIDVDNYNYDICMFLLQFTQWSLAIVNRFQENGT